MQITVHSASFAKTSHFEAELECKPCLTCRRLLVHARAEPVIADDVCQPHPFAADDDAALRLGCGSLLRRRSCTE